MHSQNLNLPPPSVSIYNAVSINTAFVCSNEHCAQEEILPAIQDARVAPWHLLEGPGKTQPEALENQPLPACSDNPELDEPMV